MQQTNAPVIVSLLGKEFPTPTWSMHTLLPVNIRTTVCFRLPHPSNKEPCCMSLNQGSYEFGMHSEALLGVN
jgi:hypothetical protein